MKIRKAEQKDLERIAEIESICFPAAEAAGIESIKHRLNYFADHFWVAEMNGEMIGFINGMVTEYDTIHDEMYEDASLHKKDGAWQSVFGLDVLPAYRNHGYAAELMHNLIQEAKEANRKGCILTCKEYLVHYYEKFGYVCKGKSESVHGGAVWFDMILTF